MGEVGFEPSGTLGISVWWSDGLWMARLATSTRPDEPLDFSQSPRLMTPDEICDSVRNWLDAVRQPG